jgi:hypothetical protein
MGTNSNPLDISAIISILAAVVTLAGAAVTLYKARPERRKIEAEGSHALADAAESVASGAKISTDLLLTRIQELEKREKERDEQWKKRFDEVLAELADYKDWTRRLVHQIKSRGDEPVPFKPKDKAHAKA